MSLNHIEEKILHPKSGFLGIVVQTLLLLVSIALIIVARVFQIGAISITAGVVGTILLCLFCILFAGFKVVGPNEAVVLTLFGKYHGTIKDAGFYFLNPFVVPVGPSQKAAA
jgi:regulator of protease activity HflC (stomatin/prohibitin superfamily)